MQSIHTLSLTPAINVWLASSRQPRILHVFDHACNLINRHREVLSIVTPHIGNGPFNPVIEDGVLFSEHLSLQSPISNSPNHLNLGLLTINTEDAIPWSPRPDWERLHGRRIEILDQVASLPITNSLECSGFDAHLDNHSGLPFDKLRTALNHQHLQITNSPISNSLASALANADVGFSWCQ